MLVRFVAKAPNLTPDRREIMKTRCIISAKLNTMSSNEIQTLNLLKDLATMMEKVQLTISQLDTRLKKVETGGLKLPEPFATDALAFLKITNDVSLREFLNHYIIINPISEDRTLLIKRHENREPFVYGRWELDYPLKDVLTISDLKTDFKNTGSHCSFNYLPTLLNDKAVIYHKNNIPSLN